MILLSKDMKSNNRRHCDSFFIAAALSLQSCPCCGRYTHIADHMTRKGHKTRVELRSAADALVAEVHGGAWDHVPVLRSRPMEDLTELFDELEKRCPGHSRDEYRDVFLRSHWENR